MYEKFEALLKERQITAYEVAKQTGIAQATLSSWKNDRYSPKLDKLKLIAEFFGVPVTYFLED